MPETIYTPKGGTGKKNPWTTTHARVPEPVKAQIQEVVQFYYRWVSEGGNSEAPPRFIFQSYEECIGQSPNRLKPQDLGLAAQETKEKTKPNFPSLVAEELQIKPQKPKQDKKDSGFSIGYPVGYLGEDRPDIRKGEVIKLLEIVESDGIEWVKGERKDKTVTSWIKAGEFKRVAPKKPRNLPSEDIKSTNQNHRRQSPKHIDFIESQTQVTPSLPQNVLNYIGSDITAQVQTPTGIMNGTIYENSLVVLAPELSHYQGYARVKPMSAQWLSGIDVPIQSLVVPE